MAKQTRLSDKLYSPWHPALRGPFCGPRGSGTAPAGRPLPTPVGARNPVGAGQAACLYSLMRPVGAGNSAVVGDLPRCGPMLSPRVPNLVPIPGPRMERETPGQRPRPNYGHPQAAAVTDGLRARRSPHALSAELRAEGRKISAETIYGAAYDHSGSRGLPEGSWRLLPRRCRRRKPEAATPQSPAHWAIFGP